jgi:hypothetical protein
MAKIVFLPVSVIGGLLAGAISRRLFRATWGKIDKQDPPQAQHRHVRLGKLALALALDGALFRLVKGLVDHGSRLGFRRLTGAWPGEEAPDPQR